MTDELKRLLEGADGPREPTSEERERIRAAVFGHREESASPLDDGVDGGDAEDLIVIGSARRTDRPDSSVARRVGYAALVLAAVVLGAVFTLERSTNSDLVASSRTPPACAQLADLERVLEAWRTIETWAQLSSTDPDMGDAVLRVLVLLDENSDVRVAIEQLESLDRQAGEGQDVVDRTNAVVGGIETIIAALEEAEGEQCDLTTLRQMVNSP